MHREVICLWNELSSKVRTCLPKITQIPANTNFWIYLEKKKTVLLCSSGSASLVPTCCREKMKEWQKHFSNYNPGYLLFQGTQVKLLSTSLHFFLYFLPALKSMLQSFESTEERNDHNYSLGQQGSASLGPLICTSSFVSPWTVWYICSHLTRHDNGNFHNDQKYQ